MAARIDIEDTKAVIDGDSDVVEIGKGSTSQVDIEKAGAISHKTIPTVASSSGAATFDYSGTNYLKITLTENVTAPAFTDPAGPCRIVLIVVQDATTPYNITNYPAKIKWAGGGTPPTISAGASAVDKIYGDFDGTDWLLDIAQDYQ